MSLRSHSGPDWGKAGPAGDTADLVICTTSRPAEGSLWRVSGVFSDRLAFLEIFVEAKEVNTGTVVTPSDRLGRPERRTTGFRCNSRRHRVPPRTCRA